MHLSRRHLPAAAAAFLAACRSAAAGTAPDVTAGPVLTPAATTAVTPPPASASPATSTPTDTAAVEPARPVPAAPNPFATAVGEWRGGDVPHVYPLPDGSRLWWLNDSFLTPVSDGPVDQWSMVRNVAFVERPDGTLQMLAGGQPGNRTEFLPHQDQNRFHRWFWPQGGAVDGELLHVVVAEMRCDLPSWAPSMYATRAWLATYRWSDWRRVSFRPAADDRPAPFYGFSVVDGGDGWTYLSGGGIAYNQPRRRDGSGLTYLARVPTGQLDTRPSYWDGAGWSTQRRDAEPVIQGGYTDFRVRMARVGGRWFAVTKEDEFIGLRIVVLEAPAPQGPWRELVSLPVSQPAGVPEGVTYEAAPWPEPVSGRLAVSYSVNSTDESTVFAHPELYRPVVTVTDVVL